MKKCYILIFLFATLLFAYNNKYKFRRYSHVKSFYENIAEDAIALCVQHQVPPASVLAIAGLESGYDSGYVSQVTGNILCLAGGKGETNLPPLTLPIQLSTNKILYDSLQYNKISSDDLKWKKLPPSYKKDYRPTSIRGSRSTLNFFKYNPKEKNKAQIKNIEDFVKNWISKKNKIAVFVEAREFLDKEIEKNGINCLFDFEVNNQFIHLIGGRKKSFNVRKNWPPKVKNIMEHVGLIELTKDIYLNKQTFQDCW